MIMGNVFLEEIVHGVFLWCRLNIECTSVTVQGCIPLDQSESGFFNQKLDFLFHFPAIQS